MNHKRGRPKQRRAGCLTCKPHKLPANAKAERRKITAGAIAAEEDLHAQEFEEVSAELRHFFEDE